LSQSKLTYQTRGPSHKIMITKKKKKQRELQSLSFLIKEETKSNDGIKKENLLKKNQRALTF